FFSSGRVRALILAMRQSLAEREKSDAKPLASPRPVGPECIAVWTGVGCLLEQVSGNTVSFLPQVSLTLRLAQCLLILRISASAPTQSGRNTGACAWPRFTQA